MQQSWIYCKRKIHGVDCWTDDFKNGCTADETLMSYGFRKCI